MDVLHLSLRQLQIFCAIALTGSTTQARQDIALSQSATSAALNELERLLSIDLFERVGKRLVLNENGRTLLPKAQALLNDASNIEKMSNNLFQQAKSLRIGASTTLGNYVLPKLLSTFLKEFLPNENDSWHSQVIIGNTEKICSAVASFELDVGLIEGPCHEAALNVVPWVQDELIIVASPKHPLLKINSNLKKEQVSVKMLGEQMWILRELGSGTRESTDQFLLPHLGSYKFSIELGSSEALKNAVIQGLGIACLSQWVVHDALKSGHLVALKIPSMLFKRQSYLVTHRDKCQTSILQNFLDLAFTESLKK